MAGETSVNYNVKAYKAAEDIDWKLGVVFNGNLNEVKIPDSAADVYKFAGFSYQKVSQGEVAGFGLDGIARLTAAETIAIGDLITLEANTGKALIANSTNFTSGNHVFVIGIAVSSSIAEGDVFVQIRPFEYIIP